MSGDVTRLTDGSRTGGVYRVLGEPATVAARLRSAGWRVGVAATGSGTGVDDGVDALYRAIGDALGFPDWFGANLDALWDCLTDLAEPTALVLPAWGRFATARPDRWSRVLAVLRERSEVDPPFSLVLL